MTNEVRNRKHQMKKYPLWLLFSGEQRVRKQSGDAISTEGRNEGNLAF